MAFFWAFSHHSCPIHKISSLFEGKLVISGVLKSKNIPGGSFFHSLFENQSVTYDRIKNNYEKVKALTYLMRSKVEKLTVVVARGMVFGDPSAGLGAGQTSLVHEVIYTLMKTY